MPLVHENNKHWIQYTYINDADLAAKLTDFDTPIYKIRVSRDPKELEVASKVNGSDVHAIMTISVPEHFGQDIITNQLRNWATTYIYDVMGIKGPERSDIFNTTKE